MDREEARRFPVPRTAIHVGLFAAACATTYLAQGAAFAATLMTILVCHEAGHYLVARRHHLPVSLPYFIPLPPQWTFGTLGALIGLREPIEDRNQLVDVAAAGPLAGLTVAIPLLIVGLMLSPVAISSDPGTLIEGNSIAYLGLKLMVTGKILPAADGLDVQLHPMAFGAWVGLIVTMINLIPIGQLDGGHLAAAVLGDHNERWSRRLHLALIAVGLAVALWLTADASSHGLPANEAVSYAFPSAMPWVVWAVVLLLFRRAGGRYHPPVRSEPLSRGRRIVVGVVITVFVLIFTPIPLRSVLP